MKIVHCCDCGVEYGLSDVCHQIWRKSQRIFYCPNGHPQQFVSEPVDKVIESLKAKISDLEAKLAKVTAENAALIQEIEIWKPRDEAAG